MAEPEIDLLAIHRGAVTAPAGCGKTQLIADALFRHEGSKPILVLTHTNAGVAALRGRLDQAGVRSSRYRLATLDGFAMRLISLFPVRSGHDPGILALASPRSDYPAIRQAAVGIVDAGHLNDVLPATYDRLFVDEYQDCSLPQHALVVSAARLLSTCVLGDPMQAVFGFSGRLVDWKRDVLGCFSSAGELNTPWRWIKVGEEAFGRWLLDVRHRLIANKAIDLVSTPANVRQVELDGIKDHQMRLHSCRTRAPTRDGCVLIIADSTKPTEQQRYASQTPGAIAAESVDMRDLIAFARDFELTDPAVLDAVAEFAAIVMTNVGAADLLTRVETLKAGRARRAASGVESAALQFKAHPTYAGAAALLAAISSEGGVRTHRPAVLRACHRMLQLCAAPGGPSPYDAAIQVREQSRFIGRPLARRTVGSTLLLKGLEADVAVILNPEQMDSQHLYVAMTRGARMLVICSKTTTLQPKMGKSFA
jgi:hypothetical protein